MYTLKGFMNVGPLTNNSIGQNASYGELSTQAQTYSREKGVYQRPLLSPDLTLISFMSKDTAGQRIVVPQVIVDNSITILKSIYNKSNNASGQLYNDTWLIDLIAEFSTVAQDFEMGAVEQYNTKWLPEWVSWKFKTTDPDLTDNYIRIWLKDESFRNQYDEYDIVVIPPITPVDDFFKQVDLLIAEINEVTPEERTQNVQLAKVKLPDNIPYPETIIRTETFQYTDRFANQQGVHVSFLTTWDVLIYGAAGDNVDSVKEAIADHVLANSSHTREEWMEILPDLFKRTEFVIWPSWNKYAIPNLITQAGIQSPVNELTSSIDFMLTKLPGYPSLHVRQYVASFTHPYRSLNINLCGGPENKDNKFKITDYFPDYIAVSSTSIDYNRMDALTMAWANLLSTTLIAAETITQFNTIPQGMRRLVRDGNLYLTFSYKKVNYLVAAKANTF
ncbi:MAG: hypothetical protein E6Q68_06880 [Polynucleobacter sp.]|nr:MAG: hypothetical protein E6Q68_06880 [Polynucleobacter sp.]